jgi:hypothetical protein
MMSRAAEYMLERLPLLTGVALAAVVPFDHAQHSGCELSGIEHRKTIRERLPVDSGGHWTPEMPAGM